MAVAKVIEITAASTDSFEDAIRQGVSKASETVRRIQGAWVMWGLLIPFDQLSWPLQALARLVPLTYAEDVLCLCSVRGSPWRSGSATWPFWAAMRRRWSPSQA